jgi:hypothetical protein
MQLIERILGFPFFAGFPALALLTALPPLGRFYVASTSVFAALFFWQINSAMEGADGPVGFVVGLYFGFVGATFFVAHAIKYLVVAVRLLLRFKVGTRRDASPRLKS